MSKKTVEYWSEPGRRAAEELAYTSPMSTEIEEQISRDQEALVAALRGQENGDELIQCVRRLKSNAGSLGFFNGYGNGYNIAREQYEEKPLDDDSIIIDLIKKRPYAGPTEICEMIDEYNHRAKEKNKRIIGFPYPELKLKTEDQGRVWTENAGVDKVTTYIADRKRRAWRSLYASQFKEPRFVDPTTAAGRELDDAKRDLDEAKRREKLDNVRRKRKRDITNRKLGKT
jgi:HPt (histidine-containing phosphotransfer) domain-containing protein